MVKERRVFVSPGCTSLYNRIYEQLIAASLMLSVRSINNIDATIAMALEKVPNLALQ